MIDAILSAPVFVIAFVFVISLVVVIHELGHYWVARWCGVEIDAFSVGFGPALVKWRDRLGTEWRIAALPLGGYVKFAGDADAASVPDRERLAEMRQRLERETGQDLSRIFHFQPLGKRALIVAAGPMANFVLAVVIFTFLYSVFGAQTQPPVVGEVVPESPAETAGIQAGDRIVAINSRRIEAFGDIAGAVVLSSGETLRVTVERAGGQLTLEAVPERVTQEDPIGGRMEAGRLGVVSTGEFETRRYNPAQAVALGASQTWDIVATTGRYVGRIFQGKESADMLGGPVRIATYSGRMALDSFAADVSFWEQLRFALIRLVTLAGVISVGLGLINLMPIPLLDGGHLLYYGFEAASGRPLSERAQAFGFRAGLALVAGLMLFATWNDLNYIRGFFS